MQLGWAETYPQQWVCLTRRLFNSFAVSAALLEACALLSAIRVVKSNQIKSLFAQMREARKLTITVTMGKTARPKRH